ncbi:hypothetical protein [Vreelandella populi]|uniref:Entericidin n=1 Tax=Vreelandella populi TaxID=2498858 RepID=A0A433LD81_9GAMM|nr:hypothetical protein [Halomonas populi]RUR39641.1 hypothetical protein ELY25_08430 [Halomonas populi]RUR46756.1 hypothetical protein ELY37_12475 [Halomonas populi]
MNVQLVKALSIAALSTLLAGGLVACDNDQGPAEEAGESIDESMNNAGQSIEEAGENIQDAAED